MGLFNLMSEVEFRNLNSDAQISYLKNLISKDCPDVDIYFFLLNEEVSKYTKIFIIKLRCGNPYRDGSILRMMQNMVDLMKLNDEEAAELTEYAITSVKKLENMSIARQRFMKLEKFLTADQKSRLINIISDNEHQLQLRKNFGF